MAHQPTIVEASNFVGCGCIILLAFVCACALAFCTVVSLAPHTPQRAACGSPTASPAPSETPVSSWEQVR